MLMYQVHFLAKAVYLLRQHKAKQASKRMGNTTKIISFGYA